jgi:ribosome-binding protein aMBF1 (putative translation factor)
MGMIMSVSVRDLQEARDRKNAEAEAQLFDYYLYLPSRLTPQQCSRGRAMLGWSCEALAFRSGVSVKAIREFESGLREVRNVTRQALAHALESEGLLFFPGLMPIDGGGCPGATLDPRQRDDYHLIE